MSIAREFLPPAARRAAAAAAGHRTGENDPLHLDDIGFQRWPMPRHSALVYKSIALVAGGVEEAAYVFGGQTTPFRPARQPGATPTATEEAAEAAKAAPMTLLDDLWRIRLVHDSYRSTSVTNPVLVEAVMSSGSPPLCPSHKPDGLAFAAAWQAPLLVNDAPADFWLPIVGPAGLPPPVPHRAFVFGGVTSAVVNGAPDHAATGPSSSGKGKSDVPLEHPMVLNNRMFERGLGDCSVSDENWGLLSKLTGTSTYDWLHGTSPPDPQSGS